MYQLLTENLNAIDSIKHNDNSIVLSSLREFYQPVRSQGFAIKYVIDGVERYTLNGSQYPIETGKYLLTNCANEGHVEIESRNHVKGICINIVPEMLAEVVASISRPDTAFTDVALGQFFSSALFLENCYDANQTKLGEMLLRLQRAIQNDTYQHKDFSTAFFYTISEQIVADQIPIFKQLQAIPSIKSVTKKELYKRVLRGKEYMDASFANPLTIKLVATEACMSEYHFFRLFKAIFKQTPNQYIIEKRLKYAKALLQKDRTAVSSAAVEAGFSDIYSFSKAFKSYFGYSPSYFLKHN